MHKEGLSNTLKELIARDESGADVSFADVFQRIGDRGFGLLLVILALPSALPLPAAGYSTPFGIILAILALQMIFGRKSPWIPEWAGKHKLSGGFIEKMLGMSAKFFGYLEVFVRPRMRWVGSRAGLPIMGVLVLIMACLMILPIPLTNTFPAFVIFLIGVGLTEEDGLFCLGASALATVSVALYGYVIYLFITFGVEGVERLKDIIKSALGMG
jgi:hypothetical protein